MAVYTEVPDDELAAFIASYDVGALLSYKGIAEGVENTNYLLHAEKGQFILTIYEKRVEQADLPFFLGLMDHLAESGLTCPTPVRDAGGQALRTLAGRPAALVTFLEGCGFAARRCATAQPSARCMARMHLAAADFKLQRANALGGGGWRPLFERFRARADEITPGLAAIIEQELAHQEATGRPTCRRASSTPTCSPTTCSSSATRCPA